MTHITKQVIADAFVKLVEEKPVDSITINDITNKCGLNRQTFYYHFADIYDLVEWILLESADKVIGKNKTYKTWKEGYLDLYYFCLQHKKIIIYGYNSVNRRQVEKFLYSVAFDLLMNVANELCTDIKIRDEDKVYIVNFYKFAFVGILCEWIDKAMREDPKEIVAKLEKLISGDLKKDLITFSY